MSKSKVKVSRSRTALRIFAVVCSLLYGLVLLFVLLASLFLATATVLLLVLPDGDVGSLESPPKVQAHGNELVTRLKDYQAKHGTFPATLDEFDPSMRVGDRQMYCDCYVSYSGTKDGKWFSLSIWTIRCSWYYRSETDEWYREHRGY